MPLCVLREVPQSQFVLEMAQGRAGSWRVPGSLPMSALSGRNFSFGILVHFDDNTFSLSFFLWTLSSKFTKSFAAAYCHDEVFKFLPSIGCIKPSEMPWQQMFVRTVFQWGCLRSCHCDDPRLRLVQEFCAFVLGGNIPLVLSLHLLNGWSEKIEEGMMLTLILSVSFCKGLPSRETP